MVDLYLLLVDLYLLLVNDVSQSLPLTVDRHNSIVGMSFAYRFVLPLVTPSHDRVLFISFIFNKISTCADRQSAFDFWLVDRHFVFLFCFWSLVSFLLRVSYHSNLILSSLCSMNKACFTDLAIILLSPVPPQTTWGPCHRPHFQKHRCSRNTQNIHWHCDLTHFMHFFFANT